MKAGTPRSLALALALVLVAAAIPALGGERSVPAGFQRLASLVGTWQATGPDGTPATITYRLVSDGTALLEEMSHEGMITMYYPDGDAVMLTHYCAGNNQPRLRATGPSADGRTLRFDFQDITNLTDPKTEYMSDLTITFLDADHFRQEWTGTKEGEKSVMTVDWTRVR